MRIYMNRPILFFLGLSMFWTVSMFVAPALLPPGTAVELDGTGIYDHQDKWEELDPYTGAIYAFGDSQCHQMENRSYHIHGNQVPICSRCMGLFIWANLGLIAAMMVIPEYDISATAIKIFPRRLRDLIFGKRLIMVSWLLLAFLCILPTGIDGFYQLLTPYESTNFIRLVSSIPTGWFGGFAIGLMMNNIHYNMYGKDEERRDDEGPYVAPKDYSYKAEEPQ